MLEYIKYIYINERRVFDYMNNKNDEVYIDLRQLFRLFLNKSWLIAFVSILCALIIFLGTYFFITPQYEADIMVYVNNSSLSIGSTSFSISSSEISAAQSLVDTYVVILNSRSTLDELAAQAKVDYTSRELDKMITAEAVNDTEIFKVTVTSPDPEEAARIANAVAIVLPAKIADTVEGSSVRIVDYAQVPTHMASPSYTKNTVLGFIAGLLLSSVVIVCFDLFNNSVRSEDYLTETYPEIPLLTVIPDTATGKESSYYKRRGYSKKYGYYNSYAKLGGGDD